MMFQDVKEKMVECIKQDSANFSITNSEKIIERSTKAVDIILDTINNNLMDSGLYDVEKFEFDFETFNGNLYFAIWIGMYICVADMQDEGKCLLDFIECSDGYSIYPNKITENGEEKNIICMELRFNCEVSNHE